MDSIPDETQGSCFVHAVLSVVEVANVHDPGTIFEWLGRANPSQANNALALSRRVERPPGRLQGLSTSRLPQVCPEVHHILSIVWPIADQDLGATHLTSHEIGTLYQVPEETWNVR